MTRAFVLTYHSHNIGGADYAANDHVAFASDLRTITAAGARIVPLQSIVDALAAGLPGDEGEIVVGLSFDDGPVFDFSDFVHPRFGPQRSFLNIMGDFRAENGAAVQSSLHATSFVIASREARSAMERAEDCGYTYLQDWLGESWWPRAAESGYMGIGNHSWDHVHHAVPRLAVTRDERDNFAVVDNYVDADREVRQAGAYIDSRIGRHCDLFAYPFGHVNAFLVEDYMPRRRFEHGLRAAFGVEGRGVHRGDSVWNIPRLVCGHHWKSPRQLEAILRS